MTDKIKCVFVVGPTASGKTAVGVRLAKRFDGEIVSADSMQIYKGIHIASAAPDAEEMQGVPHHLIEFLPLSKPFSVSEYTTLARECIKDIHSRKKLPIIVGGTGLYISSLLDNTEYTDSKTDYALRAELESEFDKVGAEEMLKRLSRFDADTAKRLHPNDRRRIIRAFELYYTAGKTVTEQNALSHKNESFLDPLVLGLTCLDREKLYKRINRRVDIMMANGLLEEARTTYDARSDKGAFQAIGHKELYGCFSGDVTLEEAAELLKRQTRRYAKRQLTWFRRDSRINWLYTDTDADVSKTAEALVNNFLKGESR